MKKNKKFYFMTLVCLTVLVSILALMSQKSISASAAETLEQKRQRLTSTDYWIKDYRERHYKNGLQMKGGLPAPFPYFEVIANDPIVNIIPEEEFYIVGEARTYIGEKYGYIIETFRNNNINHSVVQVIEIPRIWDKNSTWYEYGLKPLFEYEFACIPSGNGKIGVRETTFFENEYVWNDTRNTNYEFRNYTGSPKIAALPTDLLYGMNFHSPQFWGSNKFYIKDITYTWEVANAQTPNKAHGVEYYDEAVDGGAFLTEKDLYFSFHDLIINNDSEAIFIDGIKIMASTATFGLSGIIEKVVNVGLLVWDIREEIVTIKKNIEQPKYQTTTTTNRSQYKCSYNGNPLDQIKLYEGLMKIDGVYYDGKSNRPLTVTDFNTYTDTGSNDVSAAFKIDHYSEGDAFSLTTFFKFNVYKRNFDQPLFTAYQLKEEKLGNSDYYKEIAKPTVDGKGEFLYNLDQSYVLYNYFKNASCFKLKLPTGVYRINLKSGLYTIQFAENGKPAIYGADSYYFWGSESYLEITYKYYNASVDTFKIELLKIGISAFSNRTDINSIFIPNTVTSIGDGAFQNCTQLKKVYIQRTAQSGIIQFGSNIFSKCHQSLKIIVPDINSYHIYMNAASTTYRSKITTPIYYNIEYRDVGGASFSGTHENGYPITHNYGQVTDLRVATKNNCSFGGWFTNSAGTGNTITFLTATGYTENITLYAKWYNVWNGTTASAFAGGNGTASSPYQISSGSQLAYLAEKTSQAGWSFNKYFVLTNDILLNDIFEYANWRYVSPPNKWSPIGTSASPFQGNFNGNNHVIKGLYVYGEFVYQGLFGVVNGGTLGNIGIEQSYIKGARYLNYYVKGNIAGQVENGSMIVNCYSGKASATLTLDPPDGDIIAPPPGVVICPPGDDDLPTVNVGGIAGSIVGSSVINCYNAGTVYTSKGFAGGIAGIVDNGVLINNCNLGWVRSAVSITEKTGQIAGSADSGSTIDYNYFRYMYAVDFLEFVGSNWHSSNNRVFLDSGVLMLKNGSYQSITVGGTECAFLMDALNAAVNTAGILPSAGIEYLTWQNSPFPSFCLN